MAHVLYRFYSATGQLLYVGITMNPAQRFKSHRKSKDWWSEIVGITLEHYANREELADAERRAIQVERPLHNVVRPTLKPNPPQSAESIPIHSEVLPDVDAIGLFTNPEPGIPDALRSLFGRSSGRDTRYGHVTDEEFQRHEAEGEARAAARRDCRLCDAAGYRGMVVCDHIDRWNGGLQAAQRQAQKERMEVIDGGGV